MAPLELTALRPRPVAHVVGVGTKSGWTEPTHLAAYVQVGRRADLDDEITQDRIDRDSRPSQSLIEISDAVEHRQRLCPLASGRAPRTSCPVSTAMSALLGIFSHFGSAVFGDSAAWRAVAAGLSPLADRGVEGGHAERSLAALDLSVRRVWVGQLRAAGLIAVGDHDAVSRLASAFRGRFGRQLRRRHVRPADVYRPRHRPAGLGTDGAMRSRRPRRSDARHTQHA